jgi:biofilm PGA synthesis N-glycosyltransferase PgaC
MAFELLDQAGFLIGEFADYLYLQFVTRDAWGWFWFFMPMVILAEGPRYVLPAIGMLVLRGTGRLRGDEYERSKAAFLATKPSVSVLLVGLNEEHGIGRAIESILELGYPNLEIVVVDDNSTDGMYEKAKAFADRGQIKLYKNTSASGRQGRPASSNLAYRMSSGEFILSIDADTSFDRGLIHHMIGPFFDPAVGVVAGNLMVSNGHESFWARMQAIEYVISIGLWKQWLDVFGMNILASGALGAFRRSVLDRVGGWDQELGEDACLSLKARKLGYRIAFAEQAIALTEAPSSLKVLAKQRHRWDKSSLRTFYRKHGDLFNFMRYDWRNCVELAQEWFFSVFCSLTYPIYLMWMLWYDWRLMLFVWAVCIVMYTGTSFFSAMVALSFSERKLEDFAMFRSLLVFPVYKGMMRWVRFYSMVLEGLHINYEDSYMPQSAWRNAPRF